MFDLSPQGLNEKIIKLEQIPGKTAKDSTGVIDRSLFKDDETANKLIAFQNPQTTLWTLRYERGALPEKLKNLQWTSIKNLMQDVTMYFAKRNIKVAGIV